MSASTRQSGPAPFALAGGRLRPLHLGYALVFLALGCGNPKVEKYKVAKEQTPPAEAHEGSSSSGEHSNPHAPEAKAGPQRILAAVFTRPHLVWFFKLGGAPEQVEPHKAAFVELIRSVRFQEETEGGAPKAEWKLPAGWEQQAGNGMRFATLRPAKDSPGLELTVIPMPPVTEQVSDLLANVNRWRGQVGLEATTADELKSAVQTIDAGGHQASLVDLVGKAATATPAPAAGTAPSGGRSGPAGGPSTKGEISYTLPEGWSEDARPKPMRLVSITVREGAEEAEVSITPLPGTAGGLHENVNRWRTQVKLEALEPDELEKTIQVREVAGIKAHYTDISGPESAGAKRERLLGLGLARGGKTWFFKLKGSAALVEAHKARFDTFLQSVSFPEGAGK